ncbi:MAG: iron ABC transporter permease [Phycisphaerae bacterium]|nr:iron ABC transporter permease [Phycisphaerae bacterium]
MPAPRLPRNAGNYALLALLLAGLGFALIYPIALTLRGAFARDVAAGTGWTLDNLRLVFEDPTLVAGLVNSLKVAAATTTGAILLALPLAVLSARFVYPLKGLFNALILVPLILPPFVGAIGFKLMWGREGAIAALTGLEFDLMGSARFWGVVAVQALNLYPIIYLNATAALANLDPALDEAAENLGASWWRRFFTITLPLIRPGLFAGGTIVFIWSFTELGTPMIFDYTRVTPVQIFNGLKDVESSAQPYALTLLMLVVAGITYTLGRAVLGGRAYAMYAKASRASSESALRGPAAWAATGLFTFVCGLALLPHIGVTLTAFAAPGSWYQSVLPREFTLSHFGQALGSDLASTSITNSLVLASMAVALDLLIGIAVGYLIVRTNIRGRGLLDTLCMMPLAVPGLVMAFGYVAMSLNWPFGPDGPLGGIASVVASQPNPVLFLVMAYGIRRLPYIVRATVAGLEQTSGQLEEAALNLGASRLTAIRRIVLPLIAANLIAGALLAFSFSMLEVSDSLILAQQERQYPITKAIFTFANRLADGPYIAAAMGVWGMALLTVTLVGASVLLGKRLGAIFRV